MRRRTMLVAVGSVAVPLLAGCSGDNNELASGGDQWTPPGSQPTETAPNRSPTSTEPPPSPSEAPTETATSSGQDDVYVADASMTVDEAGDRVSITATVQNDTNTTYNVRYIGVLLDEEGGLVTRLWSDLTCLPFATSVEITVSQTGYAAETAEFRNMLSVELPHGTVGCRR